MADVIKFYPANAAEKADAVLEQAIGVYDTVLLLGYDKDGEFEARGTLDIQSLGDVLSLMEVMRWRLMAEVIED